jgi:hypothetical protein
MRRFIMCMAVFLSLAILWASAAMATTYYVDGARPNDSGNGTSWVTAKKTIQSGLNLMTSPGDELRIKSGLYAANPMHIDSKDGTGWAAGNYYLVRSDDGDGNYGKVTVKGDCAGCQGQTGVMCVEKSDYWKFEYITFTAESTSGNEVAIDVEDYSGESGSVAAHGIWFDNCRINGDPSELLLFIHGYNDTRVHNCIIKSDSNSCQSGEGAIIIAEGPSGAYDDGVQFYNNNIRGDYNYEYSALTVKRSKNIEIKGNWIHDIAYSAITLRHAEGTNDVYNNVIRLGGPNWHSGNVPFVIWLRGMTACKSDNTGPHGVHTGHIYNNTIDMNGVSVSDGVFCTQNDSRDCIIQNNLIIGDITSLIYQRGANPWWDFWDYNHAGGDCIDCPAEYRAADNYIRNNVVTGIWENEESGANGGLPSNLGWTFNSNTQRAGTTFIDLTSSRAPFPYYNLMADREGTDSSPVPSSDYNGNLRQSPPDVGAFEYGYFPPDPPLDLKIIRNLH